jgi:hypothetical protein
MKTLTLFLLISFGFPSPKPCCQRNYEVPDFLSGYWFRPFVSEQEAIEHAAQMADRWNRIYMRTLRNLRDLRRYSVIINNPQQVNIAGDGGSQTNLARKD